MLVGGNTDYAYIRRQKRGIRTLIKIHQQCKLSATEQNSQQHSSYAYRFWISDSQASMSLVFFNVISAIELAIEILCRSFALYNAKRIVYLGLMLECSHSNTKFYVFRPVHVLYKRYLFYVFFIHLLFIINKKNIPTHSLFW